MTRKLLAICLSSAAICVTATAPSFSRGHHEPAWCYKDPTIKLKDCSDYKCYEKCYNKTGKKRYCWNNSMGKVDCVG